MSPGSRFYQASTSEMFGKVQAMPQSETTPFYPRAPMVSPSCSPTGLSSTTAKRIGCSLVPGFCSITNRRSLGLARVALGKQETVYLGNLEAKRDWGFAREYVEGMWMILQQDTSEDYVLATGHTNTVKDLSTGRRLH